MLSLVPLVQLLLQLLVALHESFYRRNKGLHLSFQGIGGVPCFLVGGSHGVCLDHATLCLRASDKVSHEFFPTDSAN